MVIVIGVWIVAAFVLGYCVASWRWENKCDDCAERLKRFYEPKEGE